MKVNTLFGIMIGLAAGAGCLVCNKIGTGKWLPKKEDLNAKTPVQKEMQNITMKPQAQMDSFVRQL